MRVDPVKQAARINDYRESLRLKNKNTFVTVCAWCKEMVKKNGKWVKGKAPDDVLESHGICDNCQEKVKEKLKHA